MNRIITISHVDGGSVVIDNVEDIQVGKSGNLNIQSIDKYGGTKFTGYAAGQWLDFTSEVIPHHD